MDIRRLFKSLWRKAWIMIILAALGGGLVGYLTIYRSVPIYEADTTLYIMNIEKVLQKGQTLTTGDLNYSLQLVQNFSELIKSRRVTDEAITILKSNGMNYVNEDLLNSMVSLGNQKNSNIIVISAVSTNPQTAALASNAMSKAFVDTLNALTNSKSIDILDPAVTPSYPLPNNSKQKILIGILTGIFLGFAMIYTQELFDTTVRSAEDIEQGLNLRVIGIIPEHQIK